MIGNSDEPTRKSTVVAASLQTDEYWMTKALDYAREAGKQGEVPLFLWRQIFKKTREQISNHSLTAGTAVFCDHCDLCSHFFQVPAAQDICSSFTTEKGDQ